MPVRLCLRLRLRPRLPRSLVAKTDVLLDWALTNSVGRWELDFVCALTVFILVCPLLAFEWAPQRKHETDPLGHNSWLM